MHSFHVRQPKQNKHLSLEHELDQVRRANESTCAQQRYALYLPLILEPRVYFREQIAQHKKVPLQRCAQD